MHRINYVSCLSANVAAVNTFKCLRGAGSIAESLEDGCGRCIYTLHLAYALHKGFSCVMGGAVWRLHLWYSSFTRHIFHSPPTCVSPQCVCGEGGAPMMDVA